MRPVLAPGGCMDLPRIAALPEIPLPSQPLTPEERAALRHRIAEQLHQALRGVDERLAAAYAAVERAGGF